jgi:hypothetical protein
MANSGFQHNMSTDADESALLDAGDKNDAYA